MWLIQLWEERAASIWQRNGKNIHTNIHKIPLIPERAARAPRLTRAAGSKLEQARRACGLSGAKARVNRLAICVDSRRCGELARLAKHGSAVLVCGFDAHTHCPLQQPASKPALNLTPTTNKPGLNLTALDRETKYPTPAIPLFSHSSSSYRAAQHPEHQSPYPGHPE